jgi:regulator of replication initiation timing
MRELEKAALFEQVTEMLQDIDSIFKEYGFDPDSFDETELEEFEDDVGEAYKHINRLKKAIDA